MKRLCFLYFFLFKFHWTQLSKEKNREQLLSQSGHRSGKNRRSRSAFRHSLHEKEKDEIVLLNSYKLFHFVTFRLIGDNWVIEDIEIGMREGRNGDLAEFASLETSCLCSVCNESESATIIRYTVNCFVILISSLLLRCTQRSFCVTESTGENRFRDRALVVSCF